MVSAKKKVFVALSGGVDSSTSAALLLEAGFDCAGMFMITNEQAGNARMDTEKTAWKLGIKLHILDLSSDFELTFDYFCSEHTKGRTPNPCVLCNRYIKFGKLWDFALYHGADLLATGLYARILKQNDQACLYEHVKPAKDQPHVLSMINKNILPNIVLPMGEHSKEQTRELAATFGLDAVQKAESQETCFIPDDDYVAVLEQRCPDLVRKGNIVDSSGKIPGEHNGVHRFTIGQRRPWSCYGQVLLRGEN